MLIFILSTGIALLFYWDNQQQPSTDLTDSLILEEEVLDEDRKQPVALPPVKNTQGIQQEKTLTSPQYTNGSNKEDTKENNRDSSYQNTASLAQQGVKQPLQDASKENVTPRKPSIEIEKRVLSLSLSDKISDAYSALLAGNYEQAKTEYIGILSEHPKQIDALLGLAKIHSHENNSQAARRLYEKVLLTDDANTVAQLGLLHTYQEDSSFEKISILQDLSSKYPANSQIALSLGHELATQSKWLDAQKAYFKAFSLAPSNAVYAYNLAVSLDQLEKYDAAKTFYKKALTLNEKSATTLNATAVKNRLLQLGGFYE